jgi:outer membrane protein assembly factor BamA
VRRSIGLIILALLGIASQLRAQDWGVSYFPYVTSRSSEFPVFAFRFLYSKPSAWDKPYVAAGDLRADVGVGVRGGWLAGVRFRAPGLWDGWRIRAELSAAKSPRQHYFGLGNATEVDDQIVASEEFFYRVRRTRYRANVEVTRRLAGNLHASVSPGISFVRYSAHSGASAFANDFGSESEDTDATVRTSLIFDTRDTDYNTQHGVLLEVGGAAGTGGDGYTRLYTNLRGWLSIREGTVLAGRFVAAGMGGTPPLDARFNLEMWERQVRAYGGDQSNRGTSDGRFLGTDAIFVNTEVRHDLLNLGDYGALTLLAYFDAGRVFETESFRLTTEGFHVGVGGGLALRVLRSNILTFNFGDGPEGFEFEFGTGWMF